jgi:hypothetical protein
MHVEACCKACGQKYIEESGEFNYRKFEAATKTCAKCEHWSPHIDDASAAEAEAANLERFAENCGYWLCNDGNGRCPIVLEEYRIRGA